MAEQRALHCGHSCRRRCRYQHRHCCCACRFWSLSHVLPPPQPPPQVGNGKLSLTEQRAHFALWALMKAPLLVGTDLRTASGAVKRILLADEVIAINQDSLGVAGDLVWKQGPNEVQLVCNGMGLIEFSRVVYYDAR